MEDGAFTKNSLPTKSVELKDSKSTDISEGQEFLKSVLPILIENYRDGVNSYIYLETHENSYLLCGPKVFTWHKESWYECTINLMDNSIDEIFPLFRDSKSIVLASNISSIVEDFELENLLLFDSSNIQDWFSEELSQVEYMDSGWYEVPILDNSISITFIDSWFGGTYGPVSPNPTSQFHRLRILSMKLAQDGFNVSVDWGPFDQNYDWIQKDELPLKGNIKFIAMGADTCSTSDGELPTLLISSDTDSEFIPFIEKMIRLYNLEK